MSNCNPTTITQKHKNVLINEDSFDRDIGGFGRVKLTQKNPANLYPREQLFLVTRELNNILTNLELSEYAALNDRNESLRLTYIEVADFIKFAGISFSDFLIEISNSNKLINTVVNGEAFTSSNRDFEEETISENDISSSFNSVDTSNVIRDSNGITFVLPSFLTGRMRELIFQLNLYLDQTFLTSINAGICSVIKNPFNQILNIADSAPVGSKLFDQINEIIDDVNTIAALAIQVGQIKENMSEIIDRVIVSVESQLENIIRKGLQLYENTIYFGKKFYKEFKKKLDAIQNFLSDSSIDSFKKLILSEIDSSVNQYEALTFENLQLLLFQYCNFAKDIYNFIEKPVDDLKVFVDSAEVSISTVKTNSLYESKNSVQAGAIRFTDVGVRDIKRKLRANVNTMSNSVPLYNEQVIPQSTETNDIVLTTSISNSNTTEFNKETLEYKLEPTPNPVCYVTNDEIATEVLDDIIKLDNVGIPGKFKFSNSVKNMGANVKDAKPGDGYKKVKSEVWEKLSIVSDRMNKEFTINSAYRSPLYNVSIGGAKSSYHVTGQAVDVSMRGFTPIRSARKTWGNSGPYQNWVNMHIRDEFRKGPSGIQNTIT